MTEKDSKRGKYLEDSVFAAIETSARLRRPLASADAGGDASDPVERTIATIEAESARIEANDLSAVEAVFVSQALALDTMFTTLARGSMYEEDLWPEPLRLALKAQAQSRATLQTLLSLKNPPRSAPGTNRNLSSVALAKEEIRANKLLETEISQHDQAVAEADNSWTYLPQRGEVEPLQRVSAKRFGWGECRYRPLPPHQGLEP